MSQTISASPVSDGFRAECLSHRRAGAHTLLAAKRATRSLLSTWAGPVRRGNKVPGSATLFVAGVSVLSPPANVVVEAQAAEQLQHDDEPDDAADDAGNGAWAEVSLVPPPPVVFVQ